MTSIKELYGPPKVGGDTLSFCSRCKMELAHVIVSMIDTRPAKVQCKTCKGQHNFKRGATTASRSSPASRIPGMAKKPVEKATVRVAEVWEKKMSEKKLAPMVPYNVKAKFAVGDVIQHPNFGVGIVEEVKTNGKMAVLFREEEKILVHGLGA